MDNIPIEKTVAVIGQILCCRDPFEHTARPLIGWIRF